MKRWSALGRAAALVIVLSAALAWTAGGARAGEAASSGPLATEDHESGAQVTLIELRRASGDTVTAKWLFENKSEETVKIAHLVSDELYLVDADGKKKYFVVKDSKGQPVAGQHRSYNNMDLEPGQKFKMWAKFPAPPASTEKVAVYIPGVPPIEDVTLAK